MTLGFIGLGKMGSHIVLKLQKEGHEVVAWNRSEHELKNVASIEELVKNLEKPRIVWLMVTAGEATQNVMDEVSKFVEKGDIIIDAGNSFYKDSVSRAEKFYRNGIHFLDVGISGGPVSIKLGEFAIMVGGEKAIYEKCKPIFRDLSDTPSGYMGKSGAGHFAKMVHNGIEYGMMQALAEGFTILKKSPFRFRLRDIAKVYNNNSIITSRLVGWLKEGFEQYGEDLSEASTIVAHTGEGEWTVRTAKELDVPVPIIKGAFEFRLQSHNKPSYTGRILSMLRAVFGGHEVKKKNS